MLRLRTIQPTGLGRERSDVLPVPGRRDDGTGRIRRDLVKVAETEQRKELPEAGLRPAFQTMASVEPGRDRLSARSPKFLPVGDLLRTQGSMCPEPRWRSPIGCRFPRWLRCRSQSQSRSEECTFTKSDTAVTGRGKFSLIQVGIEEEEVVVEPNTGKMREPEVPTKNFR